MKTTHLRDYRHKSLSLCGANRGFNHGRKVVLNNSLLRVSCLSCVRAYYAKAKKKERR